MWVGGQGPLGGVTTLPAAAAAMGAPPHWMGHVQVDDVDASVLVAKKLGAKVYEGPSDIPTVGRFAVIGDPQGAVISMFTPSRPMALHDANKPGEVCWNELVTSDGAAAFAFYSEVFGWTVLQDMDMGAMGTYRIYGVGDLRLGGMMTAPKPGMPPMWIHYVDTSDLESALAGATKLGGKIVNGPMEVPGGARVAQLTDPQGAVFALHQQPKK